MLDPTLAKKLGSTPLGAALVEKFEKIAKLAEDVGADRLASRISWIRSDDEMNAEGFIPEIVLVVRRPGDHGSEE